MRRRLVFIAIFFFGFNSYSQEWSLKKNKNGIKVYTRKLEAKKLLEYKAIILVKASPEEVLHTIIDGNNLWKWNYKTSKSKTIKKISDDEYVIWMKNDFNWPVKNRDHVSRLKVSTFGKGSYKITVTSENSKMVAAKKGMIRINDFKGHWLIIPKGIYTEITQQMYGDPKGRLPSWLINSVLTAAPYYSLCNLKELLEK